VGRNRRCFNVIDDSDLERVDVTNDLGVLVDSRMTFVNHIGSIVWKSARLLLSEFEEN
jgi:hypothetical protein